MREGSLGEVREVAGEELQAGSQHQVQVNSTRGVHHRDGHQVQASAARDLPTSAEAALRLGPQRSVRERP